MASEPACSACRIWWHGHHELKCCDLPLALRASMWLLLTQVLLSGNWLQIAARPRELKT